MLLSWFSLLLQVHSYVMELFCFVPIRVVQVLAPATRCASTHRDGRSTLWAATWTPASGTASLWRVTSIVTTSTPTPGRCLVRTLQLTEDRSWCLTTRYKHQLNIYFKVCQEMIYSIHRIKIWTKTKRVFCTEGQIWLEVCSRSVGHESWMQLLHF